jgi:hypothetical protein
MTNFISIVRYTGGMASYHVQTDSNNNYIAHLMKSTGDTSVPSEITIEKTLTKKHNLIVASPLVKKLVTAIKMAEAHDDIMH